jgi:Chaperone of endosialidase
MRHLILAIKLSTLVFSFLSLTYLAQAQVVISTKGTTTPDTHAVLLLEGNGTDQGLIIPVVSSISGYGSKGMIVYYDTDKKVYYHDGTSFKVLGGGSTTSTTLPVATAKGQILQWDGTAWINTTGALPNANDVLKWDAASNQWKPQPDATGAGSTITDKKIPVGSPTGLKDSQIFDNGTTVGIGTSTPNSQFKLEVNGPITSTKTGEKSLDLTGGNSPSLATGASSLAFTIGGSGATLSTTFFLPGTDDNISLGSPVARWKDLNVAGLIKIGTAPSSGNVGEVLTSGGAINPPSWKPATGGGFVRLTEDTKSININTIGALPNSPNNIIALQATASNTGANNLTSIRAESNGAAINPQAVGLFAKAAGTADNIGVSTDVSGSGSNKGVSSKVSGSATNNYGFFADVNGASNNYGLFLNHSGTGIKNGVWVDGEDKNYFSGKVGIGPGNNSPTATLDIAGNIKINDASAVVGHVLTAVDATGLAKWVAPSGSGSSWSLMGNAGTNSTNFIGTTDAQPLRFATGAGSVEKMRIDAAGNVGIGTTTPNASLQFNNAIANRRIVLWEALNDDHQFYGFGINSSTLRYQAAQGADHAFYAATSSFSSDEIMRIKGNGRVGIGITAPLSTLHIAHPNVAGEGLTIQNKGNGIKWTIAADGAVGSLLLSYEGTLKGQFFAGTGAYSTSSDIRLKKNINTIESILTKVNSMQIRRYHFKTQNDSEPTNIGMIAQELKEIFPELVIYNTSKDLFTVDYAGLAPIAIKAIQEQQKMIDDLKLQNKTLQEKNTKYEAALSLQESNMDALKKQMEEVRKILGMEAKKK